jgi:hypothetical protein
MLICMDKPLCTPHYLLFTFLYSVLAQEADLMGNVSRFFSSLTFSRKTGQWRNGVRGAAPAGDQRLGRGGEV